MYKAIIALFFGLQSGFAIAEWTKIPTSLTESDVYIDVKSIKKSGGMVDVWDLEDYKEKQPVVPGESHLSVKRLVKIDCTNKKSLTLMVKSYDQNMGKGKLVSTWRGKGKWGTFNENSVAYSIWEVACKEN
ncbi:MAG: hypothetical protein JNN20_18255 [Betaproteobacteria bacterium]|nr:hypothetical protein [Betaproteobacteria bacterium]